MVYTKSAQIRTLNPYIITKADLYVRRGYHKIDLKFSFKQIFPRSEVLSIMEWDKFSRSAEKQYEY